MAEKNKGLYDKFIIIDKETGKIVEEATFTLVPRIDAAAVGALHVYASLIEINNPELAYDIRQLLRSLED